MKEAIGGTWIFTIVIVFIVLFSGYLAISVNYSKAFKVKNGIINIIEKDEGLNSTSKDEIDSYLSTVGYNVFGKCEEGYTAMGVDTASFNSKGKYCIKATQPDTGNEQVALPKTYYSVAVWFRLDLPIIGDVFTFPVYGETKAIYFVEDTGIQ